ncbi:MAG: glucan biosynthesis protein G [Burkholderiales bacterium]|nr:glucan biosynthesis protein G [Burkholderiales bacterium]
MVRWRFRRWPGAAAGYGAFQRRVLCGFVLAVAFTFAGSQAQAFDFNDVAKRAEQLAGSAYQKPAASLPKELQAIDYDRYWNIRLKPERVHWRGAKLPFGLAFLPQGMYYDQPIKIHEIAGEGVRELKFDPDAFDFTGAKVDPALYKDMGFAGFRVRHGTDGGDARDDVLTFLGASYFRALGKGQYYGAYGRGLTVDTAVGTGEEFPRFVEFWVERPAAAAKEITLYALLDSPRVTGAYRFVVKPGVDTVIDVKTRVFLRAGVGKVGFAPLTSMFLFGKNQPGGPEDYRPQVHNSDGLSIAMANGEWLWRPLVNPKRLLVTSFTTVNPVGFGLMQRDRKFGDYEDADARFDLRPSVWIEALGPWGAGRVELVQIPVPDETNSNIVAYWVPEKALQPKEPVDFEYRMLWQRDTDVRPHQIGWVAQTRRGKGYARNPDNSLGFVIDFEGASLSKLPADARLEGVVTIEGNAELLQQSTQRNVATGGWRTALRIKRLDDGKPVEMRAFLRNGNATVTETWTYILPPN